MTAGDPSVWTVLEAVSTAVGSTILVLGAYFARRYGRRADPTIEASAFVRPAGGLRAAGVPTRKILTVAVVCSRLFAKSRGTM